MNSFSNLNINSRPSIAVACGGMAWGHFRIPLRALDRSGIADTWATVVFYAIPLVLFIPWIIKNWRRIWRCGWSLHIIGMSLGASLALYSDALLYTEVVPGLVIYYLTPVLLGCQTILQLTFPVIPL